MLTSASHRRIGGLSSRVLRLLTSASAALVLGACATPEPRSSATSDHGTPEIWRQARIVGTTASLQCVPYARRLSGVDIRGDAWTWWDQANGRYHRGQRPAPRAILVFRQSGKSAGHLAVVTDVVTDRIVVASHANWLNGGRIHEHTPIQDVSERGDWSAVRVWYTPGRVWGRSTYRTYGFIYPRPILTARR